MGRECHKEEADTGGLRGWGGASLEYVIPHRQADAYRQAHAHRQAHADTDAQTDRCTQTGW